jgi:hypothetical protein
MEAVEGDINKQSDACLSLTPIVGQTISSLIFGFPCSYMLLFFLALNSCTLLWDGYDVEGGSLVIHNSCHAKERVEEGNE